MMRKFDEVSLPSKGQKMFHVKFKHHSISQLSNVEHARLCCLGTFPEEPGADCPACVGGRLRLGNVSQRIRRRLLAYSGRSENRLPKILRRG